MQFAQLRLSKKLISLHPWASKALFARTGAEANAIALRLARAYSKKDEVAICGYHGSRLTVLSACSFCELHPFGLQPNALCRRNTRATKRKSEL